MPHTISSSPFLSLRHDASCGRAAETVAQPVLNGDSHGSAAPFSSLSSRSYAQSNGMTSGDSHAYSNGVSQAAQSPSGNDEFLKLSQPQQDVLLLHGPGKRYSLEKAQQIPELKYDREILVQVLAIGLNPVDWKGPDYGFGQPSYPWVNGRDFAGIVVRASKATSRIKVGDVVFGPSTDYRDVRKAAYQEYVVTTDYNVSRLTPDTTVKAGAALGVAYVAATMALGVSFGLDFGFLKNTPSGPDLYSIVRQYQSQLPSDVREECVSSLAPNERAQRGDWLAIWGASSMTAQIALQIAKRAGLRVICVADVAKNGSRLVDLGADVLVDRLDGDRALQIIKSVTGNKLRFGLDTTGRDGASKLQEALTTADGKDAHLVGLTGLPKQKVSGISYHTIPIKIFHDVPAIGESLVTWLEDLLVAKALELPEVEVAQGGLAGVNAALDRMRRGEISGKRVVVPVGESEQAPSPQVNGGSTIPPVATDAEDEEEDPRMAYANQLNSDPDRVKFSYWVPNVSGGLVISKIPQRTSWDYKANKRYARTAERVGFEYALSQIRFMAGYGAENQHESVSISQAICHATSKLNVIAALLPGPWNPAIAAKQIASIDNYSGGRISVNVVSGWFRAEFASIGQWWLDHAERYRRTREFIECLRGIWTQDSFTYRGDFYQFHDYPLKPKPLTLSPDRTHPEIFQGGNSGDARDMAAHVSDVYFMNGNTLSGFQSQIADVKRRAKDAGREGQVRFAANGFVICRDTEEEAIRVLHEIQGKADKEFVEGFREQVQNAGASTGNKTGMWANSKFEDLVQYNDGFRTKLIGTPEQIVERILLLKSLGIGIVLVAFLHYEEEIRQFGEQVLARVRELEKQGRGKDQAFEIARTGDVYREKPQTNGTNGA